ncbi:VOC family protein [Macrococcus equi]|uniref:VOC family protein n=1 Tax=Macrococcus equi TaxID=3395462 RepID=UPI0039BDA904
MKSYWINLPVTDVSSSIKFFEGIGFTINEQQSDGDTLAGIMIGKQVICLFRKDVLEGFIGQRTRGVNEHPETIISFDMETTEEVDELAKLVEQNGGTVLSPPGMNKGYYGMMFSDLDNHLFNVIVM